MARVFVFGMLLVVLAGGLLLLGAVVRILWNWFTGK